MSEATEDLFVGYVVSEAVYKQLAVLAVQQSTTKKQLVDKFIAEGLERQQNFNSLSAPVINKAIVNPKRRRFCWW